nr:hypothetical protein [Tanacetum cinerariifolium]
MALISLSLKKIYKPTNNNLRTSSNTSHANQDNSLRINRNAGHVARECQKLLSQKDAAYHREKMLLCKQEEAGIQLNAEQADWKDDTDDESDDQELEAHYMYMAKLQQVSPDAVDSGPIFDTEPKQKVIYLHKENQKGVQIDQNDKDADLAKEQLKRRDSIEYASEMELECAKVKEMKNKLSAHQDTISILKQQKDAQIKLYKSREDKELEKVIDLENKIKVFDNIVYKTGQTVQTMNMLNNKCRTSFVKPGYLKKEKQVNPCLYDIGCYNDNLALMLSPESDEVIRLEKESRSKLSDLIRPFDYAKLNGLYDLFVPQREKSSEQQFFSERSRISHINVQKEKRKESFQKQTTFLEKRMDESIPVHKNCQSSLELFNVIIPATTIFNGVEMCKNSITKSTYFGYLDPFIK